MGYGTFITGNKQSIIQPKLTIGQSNDKYEQEADRVADQVMRMPQSDQPVQRKCEKCEEELQMKPLNSAITPIIQQKSNAEGTVAPDNISQTLAKSKSGGQPLDATTNQLMSRGIGADFSNVKIHTDSSAIQMNQQLNAKAFTNGSDVYFNQNQYNPQSSEGKHLLAHELTHVVQQGGETGSIQRACNCPSVSGASSPTTEIETYLSSRFPRLTSGDYCITGGESRDYNCHAYAAGSSSDFRTGPEIDRDWGNNDGNVTFADFDAYYRSEAGLIPAEDYCPDDTKVVLFAKNGSIKHSAKIVSTACGEMAESKLGNKWRIIHELYQLEGGPYGNVVRYYH